jgi:hypothetical protein
MLSSLLPSKVVYWTVECIEKPIHLHTAVSLQLEACVTVRLNLRQAQSFSRKKHNVPR